MNEIRRSFSDLTHILDTCERPPPSDAAHQVTSECQPATCAAKRSESASASSRPPTPRPTSRRLVTKRRKLHRFQPANSGPDNSPAAESPALSAVASDTDCSDTSARTRRTTKTSRRWEVNIYSDGRWERIVSSDLQRLCRKLNALERSCCNPPTSNQNNLTPKSTMNCVADLNKFWSCLSNKLQLWIWRPDKYRRRSGDPSDASTNSSSMESEDSDVVNPANLFTFFVVLVLLALTTVAGVYMATHPYMLQRRRFHRPEGDIFLSESDEYCRGEEDRIPNFVIQDNAVDQVKKFEEYLRRKVGKMTEYF